jgi:hypothetical protein
MTPDALIDLIGRIHDEFDRRNWRDSGDTARSLATAVLDGKSPGHAAVRASNRFLLQNDTTTIAVEEALEHVLKETKLPLRIPRPAVVPEAPASLRHTATPSPAGTRFKADAVPFRPTIAHQKWAVAARVLAASVILIASAVTLLLGPDAIHWTWLMNHPSRLSLEWGAFLVAVSLACTIIFWRREFLVILGAPGILAVVVLLGR